jgi:hypothetical protein
MGRISQPEIKAPWAISMAMLFTYVAGWLFNIVLCFCMVRMTAAIDCCNNGLADRSCRVIRLKFLPARSISRSDSSSTIPSEGEAVCSTLLLPSSSCNSSASQPW